jgi:2-hydroxy-4-carboxymuconate semialdehyde hemiacetal dehydrogenase
MSIQLKAASGAICTLSLSFNNDGPLDGIELQDREFVASIRERREPNASVAQALPCYRTQRELELQLHGAH